jgi:hypothetical protein
MQFSTSDPIKSFRLCVAYTLLCANGRIACLRSAATAPHARTAVDDIEERLLVAVFLMLQTLFFEPASVLLQRNQGSCRDDGGGGQRFGLF